MSQIFWLSFDKSRTSFYDLNQQMISSTSLAIGAQVMNALLILIDTIFSLYIWSLVIYVIASWLIAFRIINPWQPFVRSILSTLERLHEPLMGRIRNLLPNLGGIDISPIILLLAAQFLRNLLFEYLA